jgi:uncharacterized protein YndB with AHSA1/START domain
MPQSEPQPQRQPHGVDAGSPKLQLQRHYPVAVEKVWRAWTDPAALTRWFGPGEPDSVVVADLDLRVGGRYHIGFTTQDGERHDVSGIYEVVEPPHRLVFSWAWKSTPERVSRVAVHLVAARGGTDLTFLHERFHDQEARDNHQRGWLPTFDKLAQFLGA